MKKILFALLFLLFISINTYNAYNQNNCAEEIKLDNLNSKNIMEYLSEHNLEQKITKICSVEICQNINSANLEREINEFIHTYFNYVRNKNEDAYQEISLKGFKIDKIIINSCD